MTRTLLCHVLLLLCASASAQAIYKWTDEAGHVHYGDRNESTKGAGSTVSIPGRGPAAQAPGNATATNAPAQAAVKATAGESSNLQRCLVLARTMADSTTPSPPLIRTQSQELLSLCPDTAYECATYPKQPERNDCQAVPFHGHMVTNRTYN